MRQNVNNVEYISFIKPILSRANYQKVRKTFFAKSFYAKTNEAEA